MRGVNAPNAGPSQKDMAAYPSPLRANVTLGLLFIAYIFSFLDRQILSLMVGPVRASLNISDFQISLLQGFAFSVFFVIAGVIIGRWADRYRRTWIIAGGILLWCLMTAASGFANSFLILLIARVGLGVGEAALAPAGYSLLADSFRPMHLVRATSIFSLGSLLGGGIAFFVGGALIGYLSQTPRPLQIGTLEPWQMAFICVSLPGLLLVPALLLLPEPVRRGAFVGSNKSFLETLAYLWANRRSYGPFYVCSGLLGIANYGGMTWFPTHMIRNFSMGPLEAGALLGTIQLVGSVIGTLAGAALTEFLQRRGCADAHLRTIVVASLGIALGLCAPLMSGIPATLILWSFAVICLSAYFGSVVAALQLLTPNNLRASNSAMLLTVTSLCGLAIGTALIGAVADLAFPNQPAGIGRSLAIVAIPAALVSAVMAIRALPHFAQAVGDSAASGEK